MKFIVQTLVSRLVETGNLKITYPDGTSQAFGDGTGNAVHMRLKTRKAVWGLAVDPAYYLGHHYGTGDIDIAAARDILLTDGSSVIYTAGVPTDPPEGFTRVPTNVDGSGVGVNSRTALFPDGGGDIALSAGRDIKTEASGQFITDWLYRYAQRDTSGVLRPNPQASWWPRYTDFRQGVATLGGGDVTVVAGRDIEQREGRIIRHVRKFQAEQRTNS